MLQNKLETCTWTGCKFKVLDLLDSAGWSWSSWQGLVWVVWVWFGSFELVGSVVKLAEAADLHSCSGQISAGGSAGEAFEPVKTLHAQHCTVS